MGRATITELRHDHQTIEVLARRLSDMLDTDAPPQALSMTLNHLLQTVADHLEREDATIYTLALAAQPGISQDAADNVRDEFERLKANWQDYLQCWTPEAIAADRSGFVKASRAMLPRLRDRVQLEDNLLIASALSPSSKARVVAR